jgi:tetratricopeptide (TPR) repeat protein
MKRYVPTYVIFVMGCIISTVFLPAVSGIVTASTSSPISNAEVSRLFHEANRLFGDANKLALTDPGQAASFYEKSLIRYERIIRDGGIRNGKLYYNIGNIYFRKGDIGRAILNYRRAQLFTENDINIQKNLEFARMSRKDKIVEKQETRILKTLFFWHYDLSAKTRLVLFSITFGLLWSFAVVRIYVRKSTFKWAVWICFFLSLMFSASVAIDFYISKTIVHGVIVSEEVTARKGNSISYEKSFKDPLHAGTEFTVLEDRGAWLRVELPDARTCWVPVTEIELVRTDF